MGKRILLNGKRFGRLQVRLFAGITKQNGALWLCDCDCGNVCVVRSTKLRTGWTKSCGCFHRERSAEAHRVHGAKDGRRKGAKVKEGYWLWYNLRHRCENEKYPQYKDYGGRGIRLCDRWKGKDGFSNFLADMGERPKGMTLDRIDNNGNYEPGNCRWATRLEQANNKRNNRMLTYKGKTQSLPMWARELGIKRSTLDMRVRVRKWSVERALTTPVSV